MKRELQGTATTLANSLDRELVSGQRRLQGITAQLPTEFSQAASQLRARALYLVSVSPDFRRIALNDEQGRQLWNTGLPEGAPLVAQIQPHEQEALRRGGPLVTDLYRGRNSGEWIASHVIPLTISGKRYVLVGSMNIKDLANVLRPAVAEHGAVGGILDRQKKFIARTMDSDRSIGQAPSSGWAAAMQRSASGVTRLVTLEGIASYSAWAPVSSSGWVVGVAVPGAPWDDSILGALRIHFTALLVVSLAGVGCALLLGRRVAAEADSVRKQAAELARLHEAPRSVLRVAEFRQIQSSLDAAGELLRRQDAVQQELKVRQSEMYVREQAARAAAEDANRLKNDFLAVLAHEMRSPLAAISNVGHILSRRAGAPDRMHEILQKQSATLTRLVDDLLEVGQLMREDVKLQLERVDLSEVVEGVLDALEVTGKLRSHEVQRALSPAVVNADRVRLAQVVTNLLNNALRYTPAGGRISISLACRAAQVNLRVSDTGRGIETADLERIFELFVRTDDARTFSSSGLGIGLGIVRRLVQLHGGEVTADSEGSGCGATFVVILPLATPSEQQVQIVQEAVASAGRLPPATQWPVGG